MNILSYRNLMLHSSDDPLEDVAVISTQEAGRREGSAKGATVDKAHLRVIVNRDTGNASWQVWHDLAYAGPRKDVGAVHYLADGAISLSYWNTGSINALPPMRRDSAFSLPGSFSSFLNNMLERSLETT